MRGGGWVSARAAAAGSASAAASASAMYLRFMMFSFWKALPAEAIGSDYGWIAAAMQESCEDGLCRLEKDTIQPAVGPVAQWLEPAAHNRLVGGSDPPGPPFCLKSYAEQKFTVPCRRIIIRLIKNVVRFQPRRHARTRDHLRLLA